MRGDEGRDQGDHRGRDAFQTGTYLLTIQSTLRDDNGVRLSPGIRLSETKDRPAIGLMKQGAELELRRPDGSRVRSVLVTYGISLRADEDGGFVVYDDPSDPEVELTVHQDVAEEHLPAGTEVWLL